MGVALRAIAEDRDGLPRQDGEVGILVIEDFVGGGHAAADASDRRVPATRRGEASPTGGGAGLRRSRPAWGPFWGRGRPSRGIEACPPPPPPPPPAPPGRRPPPATP